MSMRDSCFRTTLRAALWLPLCSAAALASAQDVTRDTLVRYWSRSSTDQRISAISAGLNSSAKESQALALSGVARLGAEDRASAQRRFPASSIRPYLQDADAEVARQAARAYVAISDSDETAEGDIVAIAAGGRSPLRPHEYIRYLRPKGITSEAARQWLTSLAQGPLSEEKFSAVEALVIGTEMPPASLLPQVMELIRSPEYFCALNLVLSLQKFGLPAATYIDELVELRAKLEQEAKLPVDYRTVVLRAEFSDAGPVMDEAIAALQALQW
jgi:hypothetical protein